MSPQFATLYIAISASTQLSSDQLLICDNVKLMRGVTIIGLTFTHVYILADVRISRNLVDMPLLVVYSETMSRCVRDS